MMMTVAKMKGDDGDIKHTKTRDMNNCDGIDLVFLSNKAKLQLLYRTLISL